jgi:hypothetical protein
MTVLCNNYTYVLWKNTNGSISLWKVDPNLNYVSSNVFGPFEGWIPESLSPDQANPGSIRVLWRETMGLISIWVVDSNVNLALNKVYGPFFGFDPHADAVGGRVVGGSSTASGQAAEAMKVNVGSTPMPQF